MLINSAGNSIYFTLFYSLAFFFAFIMLLWEGYQRKIPIISWLLLLIFVRVSFIIGTKIFTFNRDEWWLMITRLTLIPTSEKILLGGIVLGLIALLVGKYVLGIKQNLVDAFAIVVPLSIGIQRIGCFLNGCCFGKPTSLPWSVQYPVNSLPHYFHYKAGLIGSNLVSLHIHPVQLYEMAGAFLVAYLVFKSRKYWKANGSLFVFSLLLFCFARFLTEFFRDNLAHAIGGEMVGIFNQIQWTMLIATILLSFILLYREKVMVLKFQPYLQSAPIEIKYGLLVFLSEALLIWTLRNWFSPSELIAVLLTFFISSVIIFFWILKEIASSKTKVIYACLLVLPLLITGQTIPQIKSDSTLVVKTKKISFGLATGSFESSGSVANGTTADGCTQYETEYFKQKYTVGGAGYSVKNEYPERKYEVNYGLNMYLGQNSEMLKVNGSKSTDYLFGVNPFLKFDANWIGIGGGVHVGNLFYPKNSKDYKYVSDLGTGLKDSPFYPQAYFRFGPKRIVYIDYHLADQFVTPFPGFYQELGLGTGLGSKNGTNIRGGLILLPREDVVYRYLSAYLPVSKTFSLEPMLVLSDQAITQFSLGFHYNFSSTTHLRKPKER